MFDLNLIPFKFVGGAEQTEMPELYGASAPRRAARNRAQEQLVIFFALQGTAPLSPEGMHTILEHVFSVYFQTSGSVTAALRTAAQAMNKYLLERNLKTSTAGRQAIGLLNLAVVHGDNLYLAQCGAAYAFLIGPQSATVFNDPQYSTRGLGLTRTTAVRYYQAGLADGNYLLLAANPPASWNTATLGNSPSGDLDGMRRRLLNQDTPDLTAALVQIASGSGKTQLAAPGAKPVISDRPAARAETRQPARMPPQPVQPKVNEADASAATPPAPAPASAETIIFSTPPTPALAPTATTILPTPAAIPQTGKRDVKSEGEPVIQEMKRARRRSFGSQTGAAVLHGLGAFFRGVHSTGQFFRTAAARLLPGAGEQLPGLSNGTMIFIAIAVPVIVVAVALVVYEDKGRGDYYLLNYAQAQVDANYAASLKETEAKRAAWKETLAQIAKAESYKKTADTQALRDRAWAALDELDGIQRLDFQPIMAGNLGNDVRITRILASPNELFLLDANEGRVLHAIKTGHGYDLDPDFSCGPGGQPKQVTVGQLVDITTLPVNNKFQASLAGVDGDGNFMYCIPGAPRVAFKLAPPDINWGKIAAIRVDSSILYVLDPKTNSIYYYLLNADNDYRDAPQKLFDNPPAISDSIDMAVNGNEIYILHNDGHLTECTINNPSEAPSRCTDPAVFNDFRPDKEQNPTIFSGTTFTQILYTPPPDPSLYLMDANAAVIYHFSVRLRLQRLLGAKSALIYDQSYPQVTAFAMTNNRTAFLAWGNRVYNAFIP